MSGFDQSHSGAFFNFNNLTSQQLNMLRQQNQMQQAVQMPQQQQPQPQPPPAAQPQMQQRNPMMPQLGGLPPGFNQQQLQAFMAQQQSQLAANGMLGNNQNPLMQIMRPQQIIQPQPPQQQMQQQPQHPMQPQQPQQHPQLQAQMGLQQPATSQPAHLQQQPQQTANMAGTPQLGGVAGPTPTFAQLSHAIEQAKKGNLTQEQMIQVSLFFLLSFSSPTHASWNLLLTYPLSQLLPLSHLSCGSLSHGNRPCRRSSRQLRTNPPVQGLHSLVSL